MAGNFFEKPCAFEFEADLENLGQSTLFDSGKALPASGQLAILARVTRTPDVTLFRDLAFAAPLARDWLSLR